MALRTNRLGIEQLEARDLMAGNITAYVSGGHLFVNEAAGQAGLGQAAQISQLPDGKLRVTGLASQDGGVTKINGKAYEDFRVTADLKVNLGAGNDSLYFAPGTAILGINVEMSQAGAVAAKDTDIVVAPKVLTHNQFDINTGAGRDTVTVTDCTIGNDGGIFDNLDIDTGAGKDVVRIAGVNQSVMVKGHVFVNTFAGEEAQVDTVTIDNVIALRHISASTGAGNDVVTMRYSYTGSDVFVGTGAGDDSVTMVEVRSEDDMWVYLDSGNDTLNRMYLRADELVHDGGSGTDRLISSVPGYSRTSTIVNFEL